MIAALPPGHIAASPSYDTYSLSVVDMGDSSEVTLVLML